MTEHTDIPTGLYLLEFRAAWGQNLPCHQQPVVLINLGKQGRNHLPPYVPFSLRATALSVSTFKGNVPRPTPDYQGISFPHCPGLLIFPPPGSHTISSSSLPPKFMSITAGSESLSAATYAFNYLLQDFVSNISVCMIIKHIISRSKITGCTDNTHQTHCPWTKLVHTACYIQRTG